MTERASRWDRDVEVMLDADRIAQRVAELGRDITAHYRDKPICVIGILKGCFLFFADIVRKLDLPLCAEFIGISSYGDSTESSGVV